MLFSRHLHVLPLPKTVNAFEVYLPMTLDEQLMNALRSKAWALPGQSTHLAKQSWFIVWPSRLVAMGTTWLAEHTACSTF